MTKRERAILWVVDVQNDFMKLGGTLYVKDAESIIPNLVLNVERFKDHTKVFTMDMHFENSKEVSKNPDWSKTFPYHCMANTDGAKLIDEVGEMINPTNVGVIDWTKEYSYQELIEVAKEKTIILSKDKHCPFSGSKHTDEFLNILKPDVVYICGVATDICVDYAVMGFLQRGIRVNIITNAMKELPTASLSTVIDKWVSAGAVLV